MMLGVLEKVVCGVKYYMLFGKTMEVIKMVVEELGKFDVRSDHNLYLEQSKMEKEENVMDIRKCLGKRTWKEQSDNSSGEESDTEESLSCAGHLQVQKVGGGQGELLTGTMPQNY